MNKHLLSLLASLISSAAMAQMVPVPHQIMIPVTGGPMAKNSIQSGEGICVLLDSSHVTGDMWLLAGKNQQLELRPEEGKKRKYTPDQLAYFTIGKDKYYSVQIPVQQKAADSLSSQTVFAKRIISGKLEVMESAYITTVGSLYVSTLLIRQHGTTAWTPLMEKDGAKRIRAVVGPMVADQPGHARVLASGRINFDNLKEFVRSYNTLVAKQP